MAELVRDIMTRNPSWISASLPLIEAARRMRDANVGALPVEEGGQIIGIVTDRDIVVRGAAEGCDFQRTPVAQVCSRQLMTLPADYDINQAIAVMREKAIRRVPVVDNGKVVGILSLGDLARLRDPKSALGQISAAPANR